MVAIFGRGRREPPEEQKLKYIYIKVRGPGRVKIILYTDHEIPYGYAESKQSKLILIAPELKQIDLEAQNIVGGVFSRWSSKDIIIPSDEIKYPNHELLVDNIKKTVNKETAEMTAIFRKGKAPKLSKEEKYLNLLPKDYKKGDYKKEDFDKKGGKREWADKRMQRMSEAEEEIRRGEPEKPEKPGSFWHARTQGMRNFYGGISNAPFLKGWRGSGNPIRKIIGLLIFCLIGMSLMIILGNIAFFLAFLCLGFYLMIPDDLDILTDKTNKMTSKYDKWISKFESEIDRYRKLLYRTTTEHSRENIKEEIKARREKIRRIERAKRVKVETMTAALTARGYQTGKHGRIILKTMFQLGAFISIVVGFLMSDFPLAKPIGLIIAFLLYMGLGGVRDIKD